MATKRAGGGLSTTQQVARFLGVSVLAGAVLAGLALPAAGLLGLAAKGSVEGFDELPTNLKRPPLSQRTLILDADGNEIAKVYSRDRTVVDLEDIAPVMQQAIVAIEDSRFYEHGAIDLKGVLRALNRNAQSGEVTQGASTLTQQYVKNVFVEEARNDQEKIAAAIRQSVGRKIRELKYAIKVEEELSKKQILENYLNITYFGQAAYGIEAASQRYFSIPAKELSLEQAALLAGLVQSPSRYDPVRNPKTAEKRRNVVLDRMADVGDISREEAEKARAKPLGLNVSQPQNGCITAVDGAAFFCDYVKEVFHASPAFGKTPKERAERWDQGGMTIRTTLDPKTQESLGKAVQTHVHETDSVATAVTVVEPGTGRILGMGQSRPYGFGKNQTTINLSVGKKMSGSTYGFQVGSTFKPVTAAAAMEKGISPAQTFSTDYKMTIDQDRFRTCDGGTYGEEPWDVQNELESEKGTWDMSSALAKSINTYFVLLEEKAGICETAAMAKKLKMRHGNGKPLPATPSMTLGSLEMTPLTMASAYAAFANRGVHCTPIAIESVTDAKGKKMKVPETRCERAMDEHTADSLNTMLSGVVEDGTGKRAGLTDRDNAGKTGTTDELHNAWFVGYTPDVATAVWVGGDGAEKVSMYDITVGGQYYPKVCGGCLPGPIWRDVMTGALSGVPPTPFQDVQVPRGDTDKEKDKKEDEDRDEDEGRPGGNGGGEPWPEISIPPDLIGGGENGGTGNGGSGGDGNGGGGNGGWGDGGDWGRRE
ncbi:transglycosylase domain-containing protein [Streptomyces sp. JJ36]|uniref:transglycosylase domain-containing protein n=1 Tax=Streptomyces sp. JJ36 TaxID=2736645 RepID=UPI001F271FCD|nr:transglycosylase domain-containing protein [Streptomyces sp. JJ36]MCF6522552.1 penicillin-binding protein [Streptomyces sp. JJ36]